MKIPSVKPTSEGGADQKQQWSGHLDFILTCVGYSVGLGNVWRFPYLTYQNGGGAFLIPYILMLFLIGFPLYCLELSFGQFTSQGPFSAWKVNPLLKGVGFAATIVCAYITTYFNVIIAWSMYFFVSSFARTLPWTSCQNAWNTESCIEDYVNLTHKNYTTPSEEFFYNHVLDISDDIGHLGPVKWQLCLMLLCTWVIVFVVLIKGIHSLGKAAYVTSTFPYILLLCVLVRGATLPGAGEGVKYYITPQWDKLKKLKVWGNAASQIFYSTGCGQSALVAMASYNRFHNNVFRDSILIPTIESSTSLYAGFVIFTLLGYMAHVKGVSVGEVAAQGPGLVFVVYPEGLSTMPIPQLWSALFFLMMMNIGFSSQFSQSEAIVSAFLDEFPDKLRVGRRPLICRLIFCIISFLLGLPMVTRGGFYVFDLLDSYGAGYTLLIVAFGEIVALNWIYGFSNWADDLALMTGKRPNIYFRISWVVISPAVIFAVFLFLSSQEEGLYFRGVAYPPHMMALGWLIVAFPCVVIVGNAIGQYLWRGGWNVCKTACAPLPDWGPMLPENRTGKYSPLSPSDPDHKDTLRHEDELEMTSQNHWTNQNGPEKYDHDEEPTVKQPLYPIV